MGSTLFQGDRIPHEGHTTAWTFSAATLIAKSVLSKIKAWMKTGSAKQKRECYLISVSKTVPQSSLLPVCNTNPVLEMSERVSGA